MENLNIVRVTSSDIEQLQKISRDTFIEAFAELNSEENMRQYLESSFSEDRLNREVGNQSSQFYFALLNAEVVGYLKLNTGEAQTDLKDASGLEIERIYILKAYYGQSVGQALYEWAVKIAIEFNAEYLWLGVWEHNERAIRFYTRNGFEEFDKHVFYLGDDEQTDIMMKKRKPFQQ
ncbi:Ribosomal protein S18 acetylase RimI [Pedobacter westerhofensis]|uniref:Ribosomal protein S18 acetylase RimI n=1 Tax=Pedobacter westerhofensis TaxID=425512 RepID=A0A521BPU1_9SPHI|nr:GNAT family N-acetyltransferase [Pedobacter westerhofensis]SMO49182.1 Ribosomal protein S18 acetylase RimI [Pedobacter westerhofensis]